MKGMIKTFLWLASFLWLVFQVPLAFAADHGSGRINPCWQLKTKKTFPQHFSNALNTFFLQRKGMSLAIDEIAFSKKSISSRSFGVRSVDSGTGNLSCSALVRVVFKSTEYGQVAIPESEVGFNIMQTEDGGSIYITSDDVYEWLQNFQKKMASMGIDFTVYGVNN